MIKLSGPSYFFDPTRFGFILNGLSQGSKPTIFTWKRNDVSISSLSSYTIVNPELTGSIDANCSDRIYVSTLRVRGRLPGVFTYTVNNADTTNGMVGTYTVEGNVYTNTFSFYQFCINDLNFQSCFLPFTYDR